LPRVPHSSSFISWSASSLASAPAGTSWLLGCSSGVVAAARAVGRKLALANAAQQQGMLLRCCRTASTSLRCSLA
jgi:hypothetical protein